MTRPVRWAWCATCRAWRRAEPPLLPPFWSLDQAAAMHLAVRPTHVVQRPSIAELLAQKEVVPSPV